MENTQSPLHLSWDRCEHIAADLAHQINQSGFKPEYLLGIAAGGLVPLALMARELGVKDVATITARSYDGANMQAREVAISCAPEVDLHGKRVLLIDEIADTGKTLQAISETLRTRYGIGELKSATFVVNTTHCNSEPDFFVVSVDTWVVFPWEVKGI